MTDTKASDRAERLAEIHSQLKRQVAELISGEDWGRMLEMAAKFHGYSANNVLLIMLQRPDATRVAGFQTWKSLGRYVCKGEHGIRLLAPCKYKVEDGETGEDRWILRGFTTATVFDISQTDGADLDEPIMPTLLDGDAPAGLWHGLAAQIDAQGFTIHGCDSASEIGGANGRTDFGARTVTVRSDVSDGQACKTLAHELAHILCGHEAELFAGCRGRLEVEAESVAYVVCVSAGIATDGYSLPYVARWSAGSPDVVRQTAEKVVKVAGTICEALSGSERALVAA